MYDQNFEDQQIQCADCSQQFTFTAEEQEFYSQKRYSAPKRCPICRANRKLADNRGRGQDRGGYNNRPKYDVICSACGRETTVPFEPKSDRPVYCSDCYRSNY